MIRIKDQLGHSITLSSPAKKIISVVPSQTELLYDLGLDDEVIGITKFCVHPDIWFKNKQRVGGTKKLKVELIEKLKPELIIANKEENTKNEIEYLQSKFKVYISDIKSLSDNSQMITDIGVLTDKQAQAEHIKSKIEKDFEELPQFTGKVLYLIWKDPYMFAGVNTFINTTLSSCGFENAIQNQTITYNEISIEEINKLNIDYIFLSSEPYPFKQKHIDLLKGTINAKIMLVDGEMFSWYGSRLLYFKSYISTTFKKKLEQL
jgi:ABC-type Fe3+-hydroxamate transport system substrate-binding protein